MALQLKTGFDAVQDAMDAAKARGGSRDYIPIVTWKDDRDGKGELFQHRLRFLPFDIVTCDVYSYIHCDDGTKRTFIEPTSVGLDVPDWIKETGVLTQNFEKEWVPAGNELRTMTLAIVAFREEFTEKVDGRTTIGTRDVTEKRTWKDKDGKEHTEDQPKFGVVMQGQKNFWNNFSTYNRHYKNHYNRDYLVERSGNDKNTNYGFIPMDPETGLVTYEEVMEHYKGVPVTLEEYLEARVATEEVCKELVKNKGRGPTAEQQAAIDAKKNGSSTSGAAPETTPLDGGDEAQVSAPTNTRMGGLRDQVAATRSQESTVANEDAAASTA